MKSSRLRLASSSRTVTEEELNHKRFATPGRVNYGPKAPKLRDDTGAASRSEGTSEPSSLQGYASSNSQREAEGNGLLRALSLECTHLQLGENSLRSAELMYISARALKSGNPTKITLAFRAISMMNWAAKDLGTRDTQLKNAMVRAAIVEESPDWKLFKPGWLSPTRLLDALYSGQPRPLECIFFDFGYWSNECRSLVDLAEQASSKDWPISLAPVFTNFVEWSYILIDEIERQGCSREKMLQMELQLASLFNDYWAVNVLFTFHDYIDDIREGIIPFLPLDLKLDSSSFYSMAVNMRLQAYQLDKCELLRTKSKAKARGLEETLQQTRAVLWRLLDQQAEPGEKDEARVQAALHLLQYVELLRRSELDLRALEVRTVHQLLFGILQPSQAAKFLTWIRKIVERPICQWKEWMRLLYPCIDGADRWMGEYRTHLQTVAPIMGF